MTTTLEMVLLVLPLLVLAPVAVLLAEVVCATIPFRRAPLQEGRRPRLAVLVPAHNEAAGIEATLSSLALELGPGDRVVVVADNCSDDTARIAATAGAEVLERNDPERRGKGYALDAGVRYLKYHPPETVVIVDADCRVAPGAIGRIARTSAATGRPVQALYLMEAPKSAGRPAAIAQFAWIVKNLVRPLGMLRLGLPCQLMGSGMAFPWPTLCSARLASGHIVEDMKLGIDLARAGTPPLFCPEALVSSCFPASAEGIRSQRKRWEHGHLAMILEEAPRLALEGIARRRPALLALALDLCVLPLALLALIVGVLLAACAMHALATASVVPLAVAAAAATMLAAAVVLSWLRFGSKVISWRGLLAVFPYLFRKIPLYLQFLLRRQKEWVRSRRDPARYTAIPAPGHCTFPATDFQRPVYCLLGLPFDAVDTSEAVGRIGAAAALRLPCFLSTPNLNFLAASQHDAAFRDSVIRSDLSVADGMPIVWIARLLGVPLPERVAGSDIFEAFIREAGRPLAVFFFGGRDGVAASACARLNSLNGRVRCVGCISPGEGTVDEMSRPDLIDRINASGADFVVVALGARKGQAWIERNRAALTAPVVSHLGAVVNFVAGTVSRAPVTLRRLGLEWLWRIKEEPALTRRYLSDGAALARLVVTRVIPALGYRLFDAVAARRTAPLAAIRRSEGTTNLALSGSWLDGDLPALRGTLEAVTREPCDIELDLERARHVAAGCVGSLLLLYGHQSRIGRTLRVVAVSPGVRRTLDVCCAGFLLGEIDCSPGAATSASTGAGIRSSSECR